MTDLQRLEPPWPREGSASEASPGTARIPSFDAVTAISHIRVSDALDNARKETRKQILMGPSCGSASSGSESGYHSGTSMKRR